ncbi:hypothetical protein YC2023_091326 [Brassica napus]
MLMYMLHWCTVCFDVVCLAATGRGQRREAKPKITKSIQKATETSNKSLKPTSKTLEYTNERVTVVPVSHRLEPQRDPCNQLNPR